MLLSITVLVSYLNKIVVRSFNNSNTRNPDKMDVSGKTLSVDDIEKILENKLKTTKYQLLSYKLQPFTEKIGLLGDHAMLKISLRNHREDEDETGGTQYYSFFVKFFPSHQISIDFAKGTGAFAKEIFTNKELFKNIRMYGIEIIQQFIADCYLQETDRVIVFDDLIEEGYQTLDKLKVYDYDTILIVLKSLAKLHASSIIFEEKRSEELGHEYRLIEDYKDEFEETFYNDKEDFINLRGVEASIKAVLTEIDLFEYPEKLPSGKDFKEVVEKLCNKVYGLVKPSTKYRNVICHGDLWSANIFIKYNQKHRPTNCKLIDFQMTRYAPPAHDVVSVLHLTTSRELRKNHMYELIGLYYVALETQVKLAGYDLKTILPFTDFLQSCEEQKQFALFQAATYFQLILLESDVLNEFFGNQSLSDYALNEDRSVLVLSNVNQNKDYRHKLEDSIQDLRDYCEWI